MVEPLTNVSDLNSQLLVALDGFYYLSFKKISCSNWSTQTHENIEVTYSRSMLSATIVHPNKSEFLPLISSFIEPQDGHEKQDCEREASKRWRLGNVAQYAKLKTTWLKDDLYCCESICQLVINQGFHFIFTCQPRWHKCLYSIT